MAKKVIASTAPSPTEGCQCHLLPEKDMDGTCFTGVCSFCDAHEIVDGCVEAPVRWYFPTPVGGAK